MGQQGFDGGIKLHLLIIDDEPEIREILKDFLASSDCKVSLAGDTSQALSILKDEAIDIVISDIHMPRKSGLQFLAECRETLQNLPAWVFISADGSPETHLKASRLGAVDILQKPFDLNQIKDLLKRIGARREDSLREIMDIVQNISGIRLGSDKKLLVETRLMRRARLLGLESVEEYKSYFQKNRDKEVDEIISVLTTHTTSFFRESDHFDFLYDRIFPGLFTENKRIRIWSAACSTGEEVYSLAISVLEFLKEKNISSENFPEIEIYGTDIDFNSIQMAKNGIYEAEKVEKLSTSLIKSYFQIGTGELAGYVRVSDDVHRLCRFEQMNLLSKTYFNDRFDVIFIRNVLIYFEAAQIKEIGHKLSKNLNPEGFLFLGHSESFNGLGLPYKIVGNAIYQSLNAKPIPVHLNLSSSGPIRTLIVDDSMTIRKMLSKILTAEHGFEVVAEAADPIEAEEIRKKTPIDLITLDIHMPRMDGVSYLKSLQGQEHPPIVMISSVSYADAMNSLQCFELGAVDYIEKPNSPGLEQDAERIRMVLKGALQSRRQSRTKLSLGGHQKIEYRHRTSDLILIGASTGGTEAIRTVLSQFPRNSPPVLIVQHMPGYFSKAFAERLDQLCELRVQEAADRMPVQAGHAYIAPGGYQMKVRNVGGRLEIAVLDEAPVNRHKPSVDCLFNSVVPLLSEMTVAAVLLTGMGSDGARGLKNLRHVGAFTIAQDEETCVVFGMPKEAIAMKAAAEVLPLPSIAYHLFKALKNRRAA